MRKTILMWICLLACSILMCGIASCSLFENVANPNGRMREKLGKSLALDLSGAVILEEWDTHGWLGDGEAFLKLQLEDGFEENLFVAKEHWRAYPLSDTVYDYYYNWGGLFENPNKPGEKIIPEISNGYWSTNIQDMWGGFNFVAFDQDTNILYYYNFIS